MGGIPREHTQRQTTGAAGWQPAWQDTKVGQGFGPRLVGMYDGGGRGEKHTGMDDRPKGHWWQRLWGDVAVTDISQWGGAPSLRRLPSHFGLFCFVAVCHGGLLCNIFVTYKWCWNSQAILFRVPLSYLWPNSSCVGYTFLTERTVRKGPNKMSPFVNLNVAFVNLNVGFLERCLCHPVTRESKTALPVKCDVCMMGAECMCTLKLHTLLY